MSAFDENNILRRIAQRDELAFKKLYDRYSKKVFTQCRRVLHTEVMAEEAVQEVFLKIWLLEDRLVEIEVFELYLRTLVKNYCLNKVRQIASDRQMAAVLSVNYKEPHNEAEETVILKDTRDFVESIVQTLPAQQRAVYQLCHQQGLKYEEVAGRLNISVNTVKTHMKRALSTLRQQLGSEYPLILLILFKLI